MSWAVKMLRPLRDGTTFCTAAGANEAGGVMTSVWLARMCENETALYYGGDSRDFSRKRQGRGRDRREVAGSISKRGIV